jgi:hypothetical protein
VTPRELVNNELKVVGQIFAQRKIIQPMVVLIKQGARSLWPLAFENSYEKEVLSELIKTLVSRSMPDTVVYMAEAWMAAVANLEEYRKSPRIKERADRKEIVMVQIEFKTGEQFSCIADIIRNGDAAWLGKFTIEDKNFGTGRFMDFFPRNKAKDN